MKKIIRKIISKTIDNEYSRLKSESNYNYIIDRYVNFALPTYLNFSYINFKKSTLSFIEHCRLSFTDCEYKFSDDVSKPCIYNTVYSILTYALFNEEHPIDKKILVNYLNGFQQEDGFFGDSRISKSSYWNSDWWGKKHLLPHILMCYRILNSKPKYSLSFLKKFYDDNYLFSFLEELRPDDNNDDDNVIMNLGVALQYQRDFFDDKEAQQCLEKIFSFLEERIDPITGTWGSPRKTKEDISRAQQRLYHLYILWLFDDRKVPYPEKIIDLSLSTQTIYGGFSGDRIASACRDIDSIFLLVKLSKVNEYRKKEIQIALKKAFIWVLANYNDDGGAVFERNERFEYGTPIMYSEQNDSNLFATWFRSVSIAYLCDYLEIDNGFKFLDSPGYMF